MAAAAAVESVTPATACTGAFILVVSRQDTVYVGMFTTEAKADATLRAYMCDILEAIPSSPLVDPHTGRVPDDTAFDELKAAWELATRGVERWVIAERCADDA